MDRWTGVLKVPSDVNSRDYYEVAASLCSRVPKILAVPSANIIFFHGDRVEKTDNPLIQRLSNGPNIAEILVSKFGRSVNAWVLNASSYVGPFAIYRDFVPSVNHWGEPQSYSSDGFPASTSIVSILSKCLDEAKKASCSRVEKTSLPMPKTLVLGFSKGGIVLNQLIAELGSPGAESSAEEQHVTDSNNPENARVIPVTGDGFLKSIAQIHYIDVGLNSAGAYITDGALIHRLSRHLLSAGDRMGLHIFLHGTPRQWCDEDRYWIRNEKDLLRLLLQAEADESGCNLRVTEKFYFKDRPPDLEMHFEIIHAMEVC